LQNWIFDIRSRSFVLLTILFLILTALVYSGVTENFDQSIILFFSENVGNPTLDLIMQSITESGEALWMLGFAIMILIFQEPGELGSL